MRLGPLIAGLLPLLLLLLIPSRATAATGGTDDRVLSAPAPVVYVIPIRDDIMPPMTYVVRRGVKEAMEAKANLLVIDMETNGGRVDVTEEIIGILSRFPGRTMTFVNTKAFSAGAFIAVATQEIYMAEEAVIGAAAPMVMMPGAGPAQLPETVEAKMTSGIKALIRAKAEKNGHNVEVIEAMIDRNKELILDGKTINPKGNILTLTSREAEAQYGTPPRPLLSRGTAATLDDLLKRVGFAEARVVRVKPSGVEQLAFWLNTISPLLLALGVIGIYMEFKAPGFGVPGIIAIVSLGLYFVGGYVAGLTGLEWLAVFVLGLLLIAAELFFLPGTLALGISGACLILVSLIMAAADFYPGMPLIPSVPQLHLPVRNLALAALLAGFGIWVVGLLLPRTSAYHAMVSPGTSGRVADRDRERTQAAQLGAEGVTVSMLRPGGKAQFGEVILDVVSRGELVERGTRVRIIGHSAAEAVVEPVTPA